ncbi:MAG: transporter substrate-binding domain-containing protein [Paenibacillaceae bacterium]
MKNKFKSLLVASLSVLIAVSLVGCTLGKSTNNAAQSNVSTLQKAIQTKKLTVGCILSFPPFGYKDEKGDPQGYDVDLAKAIAKSLNAEITIVDVTADARIPSLETGKVDLVIGNFTRTLERAQKIDFTNPYIAAGERLLVKKGTVTKIEELNGKKFAVTKGSTNADIVKKHVPNAEIVYSTTSADAVQLVKNGQAAAFIEDSNFLQYQAKLNPDLEVIGDSLIMPEYNAFGVKKGDQDWLNYLNLYLFQINTNGENKALYKKWFGNDLPFKLNPEY